MLMKNLEEEVLEVDDVYISFSIQELSIGLNLRDYSITAD